MRFGDVTLADAHGAILAHSTRTGDRVIRKGTTLGADHLAALASAGIETVVAARLDPGDVHEDEAAATLAATLSGAGTVAEPADTGRANLSAAADGLFLVDAPSVDRFNAVDPALTVATLRPFERVAAGRMVATVKVIPFAVPGASVAAALRAGAQMSVTPWRVRRVAALSTTLPALKPSVIDKTVATFEGRLAGTGATIVADTRVAHETAALTAALREAAPAAGLVVVFGASAMVDPGDVVPAAIRAAGGTVTHCGMPVDPGNLLVLGTLPGTRDGVPVIGAPGCARSPKRNGFDFVLDRLLAGLPVTADDIAGMGVGGLLTDTAARPRPRRGPPHQGAPERPAAIVLAAGRSSRMGGPNKLLEPVAGTPMVRRVAEVALSSGAHPVVVVTGHQAEQVAEALAGLSMTTVHNPQFADGLSTSLKAGLQALPADSDAALVLLGDMPLIAAEDARRLLAALAEPDTLVAVASSGGKRGNPVAWSRALFPELMATEGDAGGRALLSRYDSALTLVEIGAAASLDADTPAALEDVRRAAASAAET